MSSAPKAGARCTRPVPSSVVTNSPVTTRCCGRHVDQLERAAVGGPGQLRPGDPAGDVPAVAEHPGGQRVRHYHPVAMTGPARDRVGLVRVHGHRGVGDQGPRRRGPYQQVGAGQLGGRAGRCGQHPEPHGHRRVGDQPVHVRLAELVVGQRGAAARAVRADPEVTDQQALVEDDLERPPDRLDVGRVHGPVGAGQVDPVGHPLGQCLERVHVPQHRLPAPGVELLDAVGLDVLLAGQPEFLLHRDLDRQAVAVPAAAARHVVPLHGLEPGEHVLEHPGLDVVHARHAVRGWRPLVAGPGGPAGGLLQRALEHLAVGPGGQHLVLDRGQVQHRGQVRERPRNCMVLVRHAVRPPAGSSAGGWSPPCRSRRRDEVRRRRPRGTTLLGRLACGPLSSCLLPVLPGSLSPPAWPGRTGTWPAAAPAATGNAVLPAAPG